MNAVEIESAVSDLAAQPFNAAEFPYAFLAAFGNKETTLRKLRAGNNNASDVPGGVLLRNNIHIAVCDAGTVGNMLHTLRDSPATTKAKAKFILATDGQTLEAEELISGETIACAFEDFPNHFGFLLPLAGISTIKEIKDNPIDVRATGRLNKLYVELLRENPDWAKEERRSDMNHFMARLVFCFFAEDTDIFNGKGLFTQTVDQMSASDGSNTHEVLCQIFRAMNIKVSERADADPRLPNWANGFPYVNGGLFSGSTEVPRFTRMARTYLMHAGALSWREINPDIFGSMIQAVADDDERGALGMHYTSVPNILKVLNPLFLDDLRAALADAGDNERKLLNLRKRMARIRVFDPACGSGNFLVIAYKQMREIEAEINRRRDELHLRSEIPLTNFRGIELRDFPAEIARLALIIAEFQCDVLYRGQKDALAEFLPLDAQNWIVCGNALQLDWLGVCPATGLDTKLVADDLFEAPLDQAQIDFENEGGETYICGNPPYKGSKWQSEGQKADLANAWIKHPRLAKTTDFVTGWFARFFDYLDKVPDAVAAFVATNSVVQGQQAIDVWPVAFARDCEIRFAHTSFKWANLASNNAGVTVVVIGLGKKSSRPKRLFQDELVKQCSAIGPYLVPDSLAYVQKATAPIGEQSTMLFGNMPRDGGNLFLDGDLALRIGSEDPIARAFLRRFYGSDELINGRLRYCLWIEEGEVEKARKSAFVADRLIRVAENRRESDAESTRQFADRPYRFVQIAGVARKNQILVPGVSSENRPYLPCDYLTKEAIVSNKCFALYDAPLWNLAVIASRLHWVWIGTVCVRMRTDFSYSNTLGWNTFPVPLLTEQNKADLTRCADDILLARESHFPATIADLYDPETMPDNLRHAHERNDEVLERIYIGRRFKNDTERLEKMFELYTKMTAADKAKPAAKATRGRKKTV
ncbi:class I SAM-dependent DNA methyltransferase [Comamonas sp. Z3]|uniref:class I SAM-dependent DNA methyltransferase n=1 Tax=Comamonas sp. Z3 TaxID=2601247 RepID=UPI0011E78C4F|nr:DNA methyltransferase [Comamonas sp. Z3]TYK69419.1 class I SAM-dependent DNA methyltransferase [Comamonas sp. Z3]TYK70428.1 class I SAM-dependent DNA methyltransferase [Comamonas sp. Z3]